MVDMTNWFMGDLRRNHVAEIFLCEEYSAPGILDRTCHKTNWFMVDMTNWFMGDLRRNHVQKYSHAKNIAHRPIQCPQKESKSQFFCPPELLSGLSLQKTGKLPPTMKLASIWLSSLTVLSFFGHEIVADILDDEMISALEYYNGEHAQESTNGVDSRLY
eukprot:scaffold23479_cov143-Cylindrotheca_fusiformis.AAC.13